MEVDLVGTDAEAPNDDELLCFAQHPSRELGLGTDTDDMDVSVSIRDKLPLSPI